MLFPLPFLFRSLFAPPQSLTLDRCRQPTFGVRRLAAAFDPHHLGRLIARAASRALWRFVVLRSERSDSRPASTKKNRPHYKVQSVFPPPNAHCPNCHPEAQRGTCFKPWRCRGNLSLRRNTSSSRSPAPPPLVRARLQPCQKKNALSPISSCAAPSRKPS